LLNSSKDDEQFAPQFDSVVSSAQSFSQICPRCNRELESGFAYCPYDGTAVAERFSIGSLVAQRYEILEQLGAGAMGTVFKVRQVFVNKTFALKKMQGHHLEDKAVRRFQQEAEAAFSLDHPSIIAVNDFGILGDQTPFLVMELINGETVAERLKRVGRLSLEEAIPIFLQVCSGLAFAHESGIVHRDIKPSNIMLLREMPLGAQGSVKIVDFGIAKFTAREDWELQALTRTGEIFGTPLYMSPEQCAGGRVDHRSDIYSLGCVFFEALTGTPPLIGPNALATMIKHQGEKAPTLKEASLGADFPKALEVLVAKMLDKDPDNRYQSLNAVTNDLQALGHGQSISLAARPARREAKKISMNSSDFYILLLAISVLPAFAVWISDYMFHSSQSTSRPAQQKTDQLGDILSSAQNATSAKDYKKAGALYKEAYVLVQEEKAAKTLTESTIKLACALVHQGRIAEAEPLFGQLTNELKIPISPLGRNADLLLDMDDLVDAYQS
jgi:serine/threonine protein kinase